MTWKIMEVAPVQSNRGQSLAFEAEISLASAGNSDAILIPDGVRSVVVTSQGATATAKVQRTTDPVATVKSGTGVTWIDGTVAATTAKIEEYKPCTAVRLVQANAGTTKMTVRAQ